MFRIQLRNIVLKVASGKSDHFWVKRNMIGLSIVEKKVEQS